MRVSRIALLAGLVLALTDCSGCRKNKRPNGPSGTLPALTSKTETAPLTIPGFLDSVVSIPVGATRPMPVVVAVLGIGDTPEEQCDAWRDVVGVRAFILCPRGAKHWVLPEEEDAGAPPATVATAKPAGTPAPSDLPVNAPAETGEAPPTDDPPPTPKLAPPRMLMQAGATPTSAAAAAQTAPVGAKQVGFYPVDIQTLDKEILAGMTAMKAKYGQYVADDWVYSGFSRGAFLGASFVTLHPDKFGRAILIEGGQSAWTTQNAATFAARGGKRVLFACGQASCLDESNPAATLLKSQKADAKVVIGQGEGHGYKKQVKEELKKNFEWVVAGDPAWEE